MDGSLSPFVRIRIRIKVYIKTCMLFNASGYMMREWILVGLSSAGI